MRLRMTFGMALMALSASAARAEDYANFNEPPSCVFSEDGNDFRPELLNVQPRPLRVNYAPKAERAAQRHRHILAIRP
jgi:hypothetical protein